MAVTYAGKPTSTRWEDIPGLETVLRNMSGAQRGSGKNINTLWSNKAQEVIGSYEQFLGRTPSLAEIQNYIRVDGAPDIIRNSEEAKLRQIATGTDAQTGNPITQPGGTTPVAGNPDLAEFVNQVGLFEKKFGTLPPSMQGMTFDTPENFGKSLPAGDLKQWNEDLKSAISRGNWDVKTPDIVTDPITSPGGDTATTTPAKDWNAEFNTFKAANPATTLTYKDFALAQKGYELAGFKPDEAGSFALQDMGTYAVKEAKDIENEAAVTKKVADLPAEIQTQYTKLNDALAAFSNKNLQEKVNPAIMQSLNARGILDSGALNTALAGAATDAESARLAQIAPLVSEATVGGLKEQYADLLRKSQESGVELSNPGAFMNTFYTPAYNTAQTGVENAFTANQNSLNRSLQTALANKGYAYQTATNKANQDWQQSLINQQNNAQSQSNQGGLAGQLMAVLLGGGLGALTGGGWAGFGKGALSGLTGKYSTQY